MFTYFSPEVFYYVNVQIAMCINLKQRIVENCCKQIFGLKTGKKRDNN